VQHRAVGAVPLPCPLSPEPPKAVLDRPRRIQEEEMAINDTVIGVRDVIMAYMVIPI